LKKKLHIIVMGIMGQFPFGGMAWQVLHYLEGFRRLGCEVWYIEDTGNWPYDPERNTITDSLDYTPTFMNRLMTWSGFTDRWAYCPPLPTTPSFGLSRSKISEVFERADALVNLTGSTVLQEEHLRVPVRLYVETDPVLPQIEVAKGNHYYLDQLHAHTHHFTYGENMHSPDCRIPVGRFTYFPTRQPVILEWWNMPTRLPVEDTVSPNAERFTTIASWRQSGKDVEWQGETYTWSKHQEFLKFIDLPAKSSQSLELALAVKGNWSDDGNTWIPLLPEDAHALELLKDHGWSLKNAITLSKDILPYREYILGSRGEFTVAKDQNVRLHSGWFSDRSACYLAAGRPVVTQDTGFSKNLPTGKGLFAFTTMEDILESFTELGSNYATHSRAAREIAEEYFRAETVLTTLLAHAGL
jgi:hypothetical protein